MAAEREHGYGATPSVTVYGQINVYGVTTKSERHKRSYWTRPEDGPFGDMDAAARTDASEPERAEDAPSSGMEAGTVSTPELIAKKIELFGIKVGRFEVAQLIRRGAGPEAIADIADSYDLNLRNGMESGEARLAAEREHGYAPDRTVADATRSEDVDDEPDIDFGFPNGSSPPRSSCRRAALGRRSASSSPTMISTGLRAMRPTPAWQCPMATRWRTSWTVRKPHGPWSRPPSRPNSSPSISTTCRPDLTPGRIGGKIIAKRN